MKTIVIAHNYTDKSFAFMSYFLAHSLANDGNKVIFISHKPFFSEPFHENVKKGELLIYSWPTEKRPVRISDALWYAKIYIKYKPEIIISHFVNVNITAIVSKVLSLNKVKVFPYYHTLLSQIEKDVSSSSFKRNLKIYRKKMLYRWFANLVVCPSDLAIKDLQQNFCNNGTKILNPMKDRFTSKNTLDPSFIVVSYLGRLEPSKGVLELIEAFLIYKQKFQCSKIILNIAGNGSQYDEISNLSNKDDHISFKGPLPYSEIDFYLNNSHYTIIPSQVDNLPTVGLESLMNQTPLVISNNTGLTSELEDGVECFKFNATLQEMLLLFQRVESNKNYIAMGINARKTYKKKFGIESYCINIKKLIEN